MDANETGVATRAALKEVGDRVVELVASIPDPDLPVPNSQWCVRDVPVHLEHCLDIYLQTARGFPSRVESMSKPYTADIIARWIAEHPERRPQRLARSLAGDLAAFLAAADVPGEHPVTFHCGLPHDVAGLTGVALGEFLLHGYDLAAALSVPWRIEPAHALLVMDAYDVVFPHVLDPVSSAGHTASYRIELRGTGGGLTARFTDGQLALEPYDAGPHDSTVSAFPVAFLLVAAGRISQWEAITLGLMDVGGPDPQLGLGFIGRFAFP
jgi:hypothetical protein